MTTEIRREQAEVRLRAARLKVTAPRLAVLDAVTGNGHLDADTVHTRVMAELPGTSLQSVYNVLGALAEAGLLRKIDSAGSAARYESRTGDNHHHLVCTGCGAVADVDCVVGESPCLTPSNTGGFAVETAEITFWGRCAECQAASG